MKIAICEDDKEQALQTAKFIQQHPNVKLHKIYYSAVSLLEDYFCGKRYDLIFMDIKMDGIDGFQAAQNINRQYQNDKPLIAFTTSATDYAPFGYEVAWRYLVKPVNSENIHKCINQAIAELGRHIILVKTNDGTRNVDINRVIYIDVNHGAVTIHTVDETCITKMTLKAATEKLPPNCFAQPHRCYYVNLAHVTGCKGKYITMSNKDEIPLAKNKKADFFESLSIFIGGDDYKLN